MAASHLSVINTEPAVVRRSRNVVDSQNMVVVVEVIAEANELLIGFVGVITRVQAATDTVNRTRKVSVV